MKQAGRVSALLKAAAEADSVQSLLAWARENGSKLIEEKAEIFYMEAHGQAFGELSDEAMAEISGGTGFNPRCPRGVCK